MMKYCSILIAVLLLISATSATTTICSFINITQGPQGIQGIQGIPGIQGEQGIPGLNNMTAGPAGADGVGSQGLQGIQGPQGIQGIPGETGQQGIPGIMNQTANMTAGTAGNKGDTGEMGAANMTAGPQGETGATGAANMTAGPQGEQGIPGLMNLTANMTAGAKGDKGDTGEIPDSSQFLFLNGTRLMTGIFNAGGFNISNLLNPVAAQDAATKDYVDTAIAAIPPSSGDTSQFPFLNGTRVFTGNLDLGQHTIHNVVMNNGGDDATNKTYVDASNTSMQTYVDSKDVILQGEIGTNRTAIETEMVTNQSAVWNNGTFVKITNGSYVQITNGSYVQITNNTYVKLVSNYVPTAQLGSDSASASTVLYGNQAWAAPPNIMNQTPNQTPGATGAIWGNSTTTLLYSDFYDAGVTTALPGLTGLAISSGTSAVVATTADHPGVIYMRDSTTVAGGYKYGCAGTQLIGGGETFEVVFQPVGVRASQSAQMGWSDTAAGGTNPVDGVWFNISATGAAITLRGNTSSNSVRSGTATTYTPTTATWYRGTIAVNSAGTLVTYTIYNAAGASQWTDTVATNIPTGAGRDTSPCIIVAEGTTDAAANILVLDFVKWGSTKTLVR